MSFLVCNNLVGQDRAGCFSIIVFLMSSGDYCTLPLGRSSVGRSALCDFGISWAYSLTFRGCS